MTDPTPLRVAVDCSLLSSRNGGLGRYLRALLPRMMVNTGDEIEWYLYARSVSACAKLPDPARLRQDHLPVHPGRILSPILSLPYWCWLDKPDAFWAPAHRLPLWLPASTAGVVTIHDLAWARAPETLRHSTRLLDRNLMGHSVACAERVISVSEATAGDIATRWPKAQPRISVIHGAAEALPPPGPLADINPQLKKGGYFLFVGTPEPRKNLPRLLEGYARASKTQRNLPPLVIAGGHGWGGENLRALINQQELNGRIHLLGSVPDTQLATLYANALCLVMPSLYEGFGLPIVEALQAGLPVITSNTASMPEVAGPAGLLIDPLNTSSIAVGLQRIAQDSSLRTQLANAAGTQASRFCWDRAAEQTLAVLREAASAKRKTSSRN
ncbi:glycosyltransferase family 1 protein [Gilvimarinus sp. SDUM040013]|uniref:Glycosyltransferase family 1 protein n=1 Tax=Gilvimarinus gilvus TaxID=3058038 RepID=A0ABU4RVW7_9GAMM|nr:glycosyltransferase family 1 protein [Gilvimarinus sp. SDUM040013]MDO3387326.1 glycosyltransferase family 1 protein [Gilvimarinus sp. SDUM040013]MDX6849015.1 glycosyltransferase family 1 protein [Gilvimarinus sp. SDUM040013]